MFVILFLEIFCSKCSQFVKNVISKQNSFGKVYGEDKIKHMEAIKNMEEQKLNN